MKFDKTEYTIEAANDLMILVEQKDLNVLIPLEDMHSLVLEADGTHETEARLCETAIATVDHDEYEAEKKIQDVVHKYAAHQVMERLDRKKKEENDKEEKINKKMKLARSSKRKTREVLVSTIEDSPSQKNI